MGGVLRLYLFCDNVSIKRMCGIQIFWFLPAMMISVLLKELYYRGSRWTKVVLLGLSFVYWECSVYANTGPEAFPEWHAVTRYIPFGGGYAVSMLSLGVAFRAIIERTERLSAYGYLFVIALSGFAICAFFYVKYVAFSIGESVYNPVYLLLQFVSPVLFLSMLASVCQWIKVHNFKFIMKTGAQLLYIYLISPFIGYACYFACAYFGAVRGWIGILVWPVIAIVSYYLSLFVIRGRVEKILFPRDISALRTALGLAPRG